MASTPARLVWDDTGNRKYETGVKQGVLYPIQDTDGTYPLGVPWNGLSQVTDSPTGAEGNAVYADDIQYLNLMSAEKFGATVEAYTYPDEFAACDGSVSLVKGVYATQQNRKIFGMSYRTTLGNDVKGNDFGYKIHLVYGAQAAPSEKSYETINESPKAITFSWKVTSNPIALEGHKPIAHLIIDSTTVDSTKLAAFEAIIYGSATAAARLPLPAEVVTLLTPAAAG